VLSAHLVTIAGTPFKSKKTVEKKKLVKNRKHRESKVLAVKRAVATQKPAAKRVTKDGDLSQRH